MEDKEIEDKEKEEGIEEDIKAIEQEKKEVCSKE